MWFKRSLILILVLLLAGCGRQIASKSSKKPIDSEPTPKYEVVELKEEKLVSLNMEDEGISFLIKIKDKEAVSLIEQREDIQKLIDYFLISLTIPSDYFWVNLNPQEPQRIAEFSLGQTEVGKILLEVDLRLKKDASGIMNPRLSKKGKDFWNRLYAEVERIMPRGNMTIPAFTRLWIVPGEVLVYDDGKRIAILKAKLRVRLESEHLSGQSWAYDSNPRLQKIQLSSENLMRELILPQLNERVNSHPNYTKLRKVFYSLILAEWYKQRYKHKSRLRFLVDRQDIYGLEIKESWRPLETWQSYVKSLKEGEYSFYEQSYDPFYMQRVTKYYFGGGIDFTRIFIQRVSDESQAEIDLGDDEKLLVCNLQIPEQGKRPWLLAKLGLAPLPFIPKEKIPLTEAFKRKTIYVASKQEVENLSILTEVPFTTKMSFVRDGIETIEFERRVQLCLATQI